MSDLNARSLTWAALLGRWVELAKSAVALPDDAEGRAWRASVADIIALQAVTMALGEVDQLPGEERALGLDRAGVLIERHSASLHKLFSVRLHPMLAELIDDAAATLAKAEGDAAGTGPAAT